jgi:hypothetical protein
VRVNEPQLGEKVENEVEIAPKKPKKAPISGNPADAAVSAEVSKRTPA